MGVSALEYLLPDHPFKVTIYLYARIGIVLSINPINKIGYRDSIVTIRAHFLQTGHGIGVQV